jgi:hypothetical protein
LKCVFHPVPPGLGYALRFEAGYDLRFPLDQFDGAGHNIEILLRVASASAPDKPAFLSDAAQVAPAPGSGAEGQLLGRFGIDAGRYEIQTIASDDSGRSCRAHWKTEVKPIPGAKHPSSGAGKTSGDGQTVTTVFLNASPVVAGAASIPAADTALFTNMLGALTSRLSPGRIRLVVFNPDRGEELLRIEGFDGAGMSRVVSALSAVQLGMVDIRDLRQSPVPGAFLAELVRRESVGTAPPARIVFLGAQRPGTEAPAKTALNVPAGSPEVFYLQYREHRRPTLADMPSLVQMPPPNSFPGSEYSGPPVRQPVRFPSQQGALASPDSIELFVRQTGGHTFFFSTPEEFRIALDRMDSMGH